MSQDRIENFLLLLSLLAGPLLSVPLLGLKNRGNTEMEDQQSASR